MFRMCSMEETLCLTNVLAIWWILRIVPLVNQKLYQRPRILCSDHKMWHTCHLSEKQQKCGKKNKEKKISHLWTQAANGQMMTNGVLVLTQFLSILAQNSIIKMPRVAPCNPSDSQFLSHLHLFLGFWFCKTFVKPQFLHVTSSIHVSTVSNLPTCISNSELQIVSESDLMIRSIWRFLEFHLFESQSTCGSIALAARCTEVLSSPAAFAASLSSSGSLGAFSLAKYEWNRASAALSCAEAPPCLTGPWKRWVFLCPSEKKGWTESYM